MRARLVFSLVALALWAGVATARLYRLQVEDHEVYRERAQRQQQGSILLHPPRGTIFDARGRELAVSMTVESAFAVPAEIDDPAATAARIAATLHVDQVEMTRRLASDAHFVWVARQLDPPLAAALAAYDLPGIHFLEESKRYYPQRELAAPVLGFVGIDDEGLAGIEALYDDTVAGEPVVRRMLRDARVGKALYPEVAPPQPVPGEDVALTLDASIQYLLERELAAGLERHRAASAVGVVLDPKSGAVLAMASLPAFDPNRYRAFAPERWRNRAIADAYEPGSTFKLFTAAAVLEANLADPADLFDCGRGGITVLGMRIHDHKPFDVLTFREVIAKSSNVGAIRLGLLAGPQRLHGQVAAFGFGRETGIDLPGESPGLLRPLERWQPRSVAYVSFGQEIAVTPLQLASAFAAIANRGLRTEPHVVAGVGRHGRFEARTAPPAPARVVSEATARSLERMLEAVVEEGTGKQAAIAGYGVAGKTGTAQKAVPGQGYVPGRYVASFVGFAPSRDPAVVCLIALDEPQGGLYHGGDVAAGIFAAVVRPTLLYLGVPPDRREESPWPPEPRGDGEARPLVADRPAGDGEEAEAAGPGGTAPAASAEAPAAAGGR